MIRLIEFLLGYTHVTVTERERVLVLKDGRFHSILGPGDHRIPRDGVIREVFDLGRLRFVSPYTDTLIRERPDLVEAHLEVVEAGPDEVVVVFRDKRPFEVLRPETRAVFFRDAGPFTVERVAVDAVPAVPEHLAKRLDAMATAPVTRFTVPEGHVGMLTVDGALKGVLKAGMHRFFDVGAKVAVQLVDQRERALDVTGQEILTRDRVTLRVNIAAVYRVVDAEAAVTKVKDFTEALHRALQLAFRRTLGALTLDQLLADKVAVDAEAADAVRAEMRAIGVEVGEIALKDVILPGEMREILNRVVEAQKEAEANVIRRREETNATRSLLNTAKVMAENPVMLRLKELEALEAIAGKVERLTVHNGTEGLLTGVVNLRN